MKHSFFDLYEDIHPWQYFVDECGMKQEFLDLMIRSIEFVMIHYRDRGVKPRSRLKVLKNDFVELHSTNSSVP
jgi:hypothetical protein